MAPVPEAVAAANQEDHIAALEREAEGYVARGLPEREAAVRAEIKRIRKEGLNVVGEDAETPASAETYEDALKKELADYEARGMKDRADGVRAELKRVQREGQNAVVETPEEPGGEAPAETPEGAEAPAETPEAPAGKPSAEKRARARRRR